MTYSMFFFYAPFYKKMQEPAFYSQPLHYASKYYLIIGLLSPLWELYRSTVRSNLPSRMTSAIPLLFETIPIHLIPVP